MMHATGRAAWLLLGGVVALLVLLHFSGPGAELESWLSSGHQEVATTRVWRAQNARLRASANANRLRALALVADSARRAHAFDSLVAALRLHETAAETAATNHFVASCQAIVANCEQRAAHWKAVADTETARADQNAARSEHADSTIGQGIAATECHLIHVGPIKLFGCPSRVQAAEAGAALGAIVTYILTHR